MRWRSSNDKSSADEAEVSEDEWRERLTPQQYDVLRQQATERPFSGEYVDCKESGTYRCAGCGEALFSSDTKFDSGSGWPSFTEALDAGNIILREDRHMLLVRTEVVCAKCGGHLGHVFDDGPAPTGKRYCINSVALDLEREDPEPPRS